MSTQVPLEFALLLDWAEGRLDEGAANAVAARLATADEQTQATAAWLQTFVRSRAGVVLATPPQATHDLLLRRFAAFAEGRKQPGLVQRLVAALSFDSSLLRPSASVRGAGEPTPQRQLIYATELADVALNIHQRRHDQRLDLSGQLFPHGDMEVAGLVVQLTRGDTPPDVVATDTFGEFRFDLVQPASYTLTLLVDQIQIVIAPVDLVGRGER